MKKECVVCGELVDEIGVTETEKGNVCEDCIQVGVNSCILCGELFTIGESGNELGFCITCQEDKEFPYDLDAYYKDYDKGKVSFKGFDTMSRGILEKYRKKVR